MSSIRIEVYSSSLRVISKLIYSDISVTKVLRTDGTLSFNVRTCDKARAISTIEELGLCYRIVRFGPLIRFKKTICHYFGIIIGCILTTLFAFILSNMTLDIDIVGNEITPTYAIEECLARADIKTNRLKVKDLAKVGDTIIQEVPTVAFAECRYDGTRLVVCVREELTEPLYHKNVDGDIIANSDGIITRAIVTGGTLKVKKGDSVRHGDVLIEAKKYRGEGDEMVVEDVIASGEVYATVYLHEDIVLGKENIRLIPTGRMKTKHALFGRAPRAPYSLYQVTERRRRLFSLLPIELREYRYSEMREEIVDIGDENYKNYLIGTARERLDRALSEGDTLTNEWIFEKRLDNMYIISVYYEVEKLISGGKLE